MEGFSDVTVEGVLGSEFGDCGGGIFGLGEEFAQLVLCLAACGVLFECRG